MRRDCDASLPVDFIKHLAERSARVNPRGKPDAVQMIAIRRDLLADEDRRAADETRECSAYLRGEGDIMVGDGKGVEAPALGVADEIKRR